MRHSIVFALLLLSAPAYSQNPAPYALDKIAAVKVFAFGGVGFVGTISEGEKLFVAIMSQPPDVAMDTFEKVLAAGNPEAKGYALVGIRQLDQRRFKAILDSIRGSREKALTESGCIIEERALSRIAKDIDEGRYDEWVAQALRRRPVS
jgi:hypothetical protein